MTVVVDTNIVIDVLRQRALAIQFLNGLREPPRISVVTVAELYAGARSVREERHIDAILNSSRVEIVNQEIAQTAGQFLKHYQASNGLDEMDAFVAATAKHLDLKLATLNVKHFPMFPKLKPPY